MSLNVLLIIPVYNGEKHLQTTFVQLEELSHLIKDGLKIVFVDDGSRDGTSIVLNAYTGSLKNSLSVLTLEKNHGKGYAIREAIRKYGHEGDIVCFTDVDIPYGTSSLHEVITKCVHTDIVVGSRSMTHEHKQYSGYRYIANRLFRWCIPASIRDIKDTQCGLKCFTSPVAKDIFSSITTFRWTFDLEIFLIARKRNYRIQEVPVSIQQIERHVEGGISFVKDGWSIVKDIIRIRRNITDGAYEK